MDKIEETATSLTPYSLHNKAILIMFSAIFLAAVSLLIFLKSTSFDPMFITTGLADYYSMMVSYNTLNPKY